MAWFFFDLDECGDVTSDCEGRDLPDIAAARAQAVVEARALMAGDILAGKLCLDCAIRIRDATGAEVAMVTFADAARIRTDGCGTGAKDADGLP